MALPKKKLSRARRDRRRAHTALSQINIVKCPQCHKSKRPHHICPFCGNYNGIPYIQIKEKNKS